MPFWLENKSCHFPNPNFSDEDGLLAVGGDLTPKRLLRAYASGIFPWYDEINLKLWWSPNPRMMLLPSEAHFSKSMNRILKSGVFQTKMDTAFEKVIRNCAEVSREDQNGTWINNEIQEAYLKMHLLGYAHSVEVYENQNLVGGLYGLSFGKAFFGESMFHLKPNASKVALFHLVEFAKTNGFLFIDAQVHTDHLTTLGARGVDREDFLLMLKKALRSKTLRGNWGH